MTSHSLCCHESPGVRCHGIRVAGDGEARGWCRRPGSSGGSGGCPWSRRSSLRGRGGSHTARTAGTPRTRTGSAGGSRGRSPGAGTWPRLRLRTLSRGHTADGGHFLCHLVICSEAAASHVHKQSSDLIIRSNKASLKKNNCSNLLSVWTKVTLNISF